MSKKRVCLKVSSVHVGEMMAKSDSLINQPVTTEEYSPDPPFQETYKNLFNASTVNKIQLLENSEELLVDVEERELPLIDLNMLNLGDSERETCKREIAKASREWGFFQVVNHGISSQVLEEMRREQMEAFKRPFHEKTNGNGLKFSTGSYIWGTPSPNSLQQLCWSEAYHVSLGDILRSGGHCSLSSTMEQFAAKVSDLAQKLAQILAQKLGQNSSTFFEETCLQNTCFLRMNRYPACPISPPMFGLMPHTDSDFLTILHQDHVGGLQLVRDGKWIAVKPNPEALIINIGDLFQVWSNNVYKSVHHRVVANKVKERFSTAYFLCPSHDTVIQSCIEPSAYRRFSFKEYREQVQKDVKIFGHKVGLARFLV
uniref:gibberellin 2beta-dioxygenase n=1 Tax=Jasminum sambac TaxID=660624 RepID=A0A977R5A7_9LAMI|nr:2-oxoglutarate-dependent dioxygenase GA 2-oxidase [Jasminum sambac]